MGNDQPIGDKFTPVVLERWHPPNRYHFQRDRRFDGVEAPTMSPAPPPRRR